MNEDTILRIGYAIGIHDHATVLKIIEEVATIEKMTIYEAGQTMKNIYNCIDEFKNYMKEQEIWDAKNLYNPHIHEMILMLGHSMATKNQLQIKTIINELQYNSQLSKNELLNVAWKIIEEEFIINETHKM